MTFETATNRVVDFGDGETYKGNAKEVSHQYAGAGKYKVMIYNWVDSQIKVTQTGLFKICSPVYVNCLMGSTLYVAVKSTDITNVGISTINANSSIDQSGVGVLYLGSKNDVVNFNTGLAEWVNIEEMKDTLTELYIYAKNLYFDWKPIAFSNAFWFDVYPNELTAKTAIEYFATKATVASGDKFGVSIVNAPGAQAIYDWAQQYADKFEGIEIKTE